MQRFAKRTRPSLSSRLPLVLALSATLAVAACEDSGPTAAEFYESGVAFREAGDLDKALVEFKNALQREPENPDISWTIGQIEEEQGDVSTAFRYYLRSADPTLGHLKSQVRVTELLLASGMLGEAASRANLALGLSPNNPDLLGLRAAVHQMRGDLDLARKDATHALRSEPGHGGASAVLATLWMSEGRFERAATVLEEAIDEDDPDPRLLRLLGTAHAGARDSGAAEAEFRRLIALEPADPDHRAALASLLASAGDVDAGEEVLMEGLDHPDADREAMSMALVEFLANNRGPEVAVDRLQTLIGKNPESSRFDLALATLQARLGEPEAAVETLAAAMDRLTGSPERLTIGGALAQYLMAMGEGQKALDVVEGVLAEDADQIAALTVRAALHSNGGRNQKAIADLDRILSVDRRNVVAMQMLADIHRRMERPAEAVAVLEDLVEAAPQNERARLQLADMLRATGNEARADELLQEQVRRNPGSTAAWKSIARNAFKREDWQEAKRAVARLEDIPGADRERLRLVAELAAAQSTYPEAAKGFRDLVEMTEDTVLDRAALVAFTQSSLAGGMAEPAAGFLEDVAERRKGAEAALAYRLLAQVHEQAERSDAAAGALRAAVREHPAEASAYVTLARLKALGGDPEGAYDLLDEGLKAGADRVELLITQGMVLELMDKPQAAVDVYAQALDINPSSKVAANNFGSLVADLHANNTEVLSAALDQVHPFVGSGHPFILDTVAWLNYRLGRHDAARNLLERADAAGHPDPQIRYHYGAVLAALGEQEAAERVLSSTVGETFPGSEEAGRLLVAN